MLDFIMLKVGATAVVQVAQGLATRLLGEQSATEVKVLDKVCQNYQKVRVLAEELRRLPCLK